VTFYPYGEYQLENKDLATAMIKSCLNRIKEDVPFGSGYPLSPPRDYPRFLALKDYSLVYD
jgi:hypothetical protein